MSTSPARFHEPADAAIASADGLPPREIAARQRYCTWLEHWRACDTHACRRDRACTGDPTACFALHWPHYSATARVWIEACMWALNDGATMRSAQRIADLVLLDDVKQFNGLPRQRPRGHRWRQVKADASAKRSG